MTLFDGATLNGMHTYKDFKLIKVGSFNWGSPEPKRVTIDIPGADGVLDYTKAAAGEVKYNNRQAELNFATRVNPDRVEFVKTELLDAFHGVYVEVIDDADPEWYYQGLATVTFPQYNGWKLWVTITIDAEPYKLSRNRTVIPVAPTAFSAETIKLGQGEAAQHINSIFEFGTARSPQLDLTEFSQLQFRWRDNRTWGTPRLQIVDGDGEAFNTDLNEDVIGTGFYGKYLNVSDITGITKSRVYRILCQNRSMVELYAVTTASASVTAIVDRMTVVPIWTASAAVSVLVNGRKFALPSGASQDYNLRLKQGANQVSFISDSDETTISIQYQNGRL